MKIWIQERLATIKQYFKNEGGRFVLILLLGGCGAMLYVLLGELGGNAFPTLRFTEHNILNVLIQFIFGIAASFLGAFVLANASLKRGSEFRHSAGVALIHGMIWPFIIGQSMEWGKSSERYENATGFGSFENSEVINFDFDHAVDPEYFRSSISLWKDQQEFPLHDRRNAIDQSGRLQELALKKFEQGMVQRVLDEAGESENQVGLIRELRKGFDSKVLPVEALEECLAWLPVKSSPETTNNIVHIVSSALDSWEKSSEEEPSIAEKLEAYARLWSVLDAHTRIVYSNSESQPPIDFSGIKEGIASLETKVNSQLTEIRAKDTELKDQLDSFLLSALYPDEFIKAVENRLDSIEKVVALENEIDDLISKADKAKELESGELIVLTKELQKKAEVLEKRFPSSDKLQLIQKRLKDKEMKPERPLEASASVTIHYSSEESQRAFSEKITAKLNKSGNWVCHGFSQAPERSQNYVTHPIEVRYFDQTNNDEAQSLADLVTEMGVDCRIVRGIEKPSEKQENGRFEIWMKRSFLPPE